MAEFGIEDNVTPAEWDAFVVASPEGWPFLYAAMLDATGRPHHRVAMREDGHVVAALPVFLDADGAPALELPQFMTYGGVMLEPSNEAAPHRRVVHRLRCLTVFLEMLCAHFDRLAMINSWTLDDLRAFQWHNYHGPQDRRFALRPIFTGVLDLNRARDWDAYAASIRTLRRREAKRATGTIDIRSSDDIDLFLDLHDATYARQDLSLDPESRDYRRRLVAAGLAGGFGTLHFAYDETGTACSAIFVLANARSAYYLFGANRPEARKTGASTLLMLQAIHCAAENGLDWFDFCGINSPNRGDYKISFNAEPRVYFAATYPTSAQ